MVWVVTLWTFLNTVTRQKFAQHFLDGQRNSDFFFFGIRLRTMELICNYSRLYTIRKHSHASKRVSFSCSFSYRDVCNSVTSWHVVQYFRNSCVVGILLRTGNYIRHEFKRIIHPGLSWQLTVLKCSLFC